MFSKFCNSFRKIHKGYETQSWSIYNTFGAVYRKETKVLASCMFEYYFKIFPCKRVLVPQLDKKKIISESKKIRDRENHTSNLS